MEGTPSDVVPEKDPNPTPENKEESVWDFYANSIASNNKIYFKN